MGEYIATPADDPRFAVALELDLGLTDCRECKHHLDAERSTDYARERWGPIWYDHFCQHPAGKRHDDRPPHCYPYCRNMNNGAGIIGGVMGFCARFEEE